MNVNDRIDRIELIILILVIVFIIIIAGFWVYAEVDCSKVKEDYENNLEFAILQRDGDTVAHSVECIV